jgi:TonB family protein
MNKKIKIMKPAPQLSDEEIRSLMDFDKILTQRKAIIARRNSFTRWAGWLGASTFLLLSIYFVTQRDVAPENLSTERGTSKIAETVNRETQNDSMNAAKGIKEPQQPEILEPARGKDKDIESQSMDVTKKYTDDTNDNSNAKEKNSEPIYLQAEPIEGYANLYDYLNKNLIYPTEPLPDSIDTSTTVSFIVTSEGRVDRISVTQSLGESYEKEVIRLIQNMPAWKPATLNGKPVPSRIALPLTFHIQRIKK